MKHILRVLAILLVCSPIFAQGLQFERFSAPTGYSSVFSVTQTGEYVGIKRVEYSINGVDLVSGEYVIHSSNIGKTWVGASSLAPVILQGSSGYHYIAPNGYVFSGINNSAEDSSKNGLYRSTDFGSSWEKCLNSFFTTGLVVSKAGIGFAITSDFNSTAPQIVRSTDYGNTWIVLKKDDERYRFQFDGMGNVYFARGNELFMTNLDLSFEKNLHSPGTSYQVLPNNKLISTDDKSLYVYDNSGVWNKTNNLFEEISQITSTSDGSFFAILKTHDSLLGDGYVFAKSLDDGKSWSALKNLPFDLTTHDIFYGDLLACSIQSFGDNKIYLTSYQGQFVSADGGNSWSNVNIPSGSVNSVYVDYAGEIFEKIEYGIFSSFNEGRSWFANDPDVKNTHKGVIGQGTHGRVMATSYEGGCDGKKYLGVQSEY